MFIFYSHKVGLANISEMMLMWTQGLNDIEHYNTINGQTIPLPYGLYGQNIAKIWDSETGMLKAEYCANPLGPVAFDPDNNPADRGVDGVANTSDDVAHNMNYLMTGAGTPTAPYGEMIRMAANEASINDLFGGFLAYMTSHGFLPAGAGMPEMMDVFFNDFIYGYRIQMDTLPPNHTGMLVPVPYGLKAYDQGLFYTDNDAFGASTRDYVRSPMIEGEGTPISGRPGNQWQAAEYAMGYTMMAQIACNDTDFDGVTNGGSQAACDEQTHYFIPSLNKPSETSAMNDNRNGDIRCIPGHPQLGISSYGPDGQLGGGDDIACNATWTDTLPVELQGNMFPGFNHDTLPSFFNVMPTAELMGIDQNQNGTPLTYVQLLKDQDGQCDDLLVNDGWCAKVYYEEAEILSSNVHTWMFGGRNDANSYKWTKVCGQCHVMLKDHGNSEVEMARKYALGMSADYVKNGQFVNFTDDQEAQGYDVHMSEAKLGCGSCHLRQADYHNTADLETMHNFLKGTDTAHNVRNDLDNNFRPKNCEKCHIDQISVTDTDDVPLAAADPTQAHEDIFGENTAIHMEKISCQACHIPYKKTWRMRSFDDTLGYFGNFDNRNGFHIMPSGLKPSADGVPNFDINGNMVSFGWQDRGDGIGAAQIHPAGDWGVMAFPPDMAIQGIYGSSTGYGIPHFSQLAQHIDADGSGNVVPMDYVSEMADYFLMTKSPQAGAYGTLANMPTNPNFDFWKLFYQWSITQKNDDETAYPGFNLAVDPDRDNEHFISLYYGNGTNGYPQIVTGGPITIMTWADAHAGDVDGNCLPDGSNAATCNEMAGIKYGGAKILYLREIMSAVSEYYPPTRMMNNKTELDGCFNGAGEFQAGAIGTSCDPNNVGRVVLKPSTHFNYTYTVYDHTNDTFPELWTVEDVREMQGRLKDAIDHESGNTTSYPAIFIAAHYFSDTHGVKPAEKALGAEASGGCLSCHGDLATDPGAHRITDRKINYTPYDPPWFTLTNANIHAGGTSPVAETNNNHLLVYDANAAGDGMIAPGNTAVDGGTPFIIVDGEVAYIDKQSGNGLDFLGSNADDVLSLSEHHAVHLFYLDHGDDVVGEMIYGLIRDRMTNEERNRTYVAQLTDNREDGNVRFCDWVPSHLRAAASEFGYVPVTQKVKIAAMSDLGYETIWTGDAKVFRYGLVESHIEDEVLEELEHEVRTENPTFDDAAVAAAVDALFLSHGDDMINAIMTTGIIARLNLKDDTVDGVENKPWVIFQAAGSEFDAAWERIDNKPMPILDPETGEKIGVDEARTLAQVVRWREGNHNKYILRAGPGRYAAVVPVNTGDMAVPDCAGIIGGSADYDPHYNGGTCNNGITSYDGQPGCVGGTTGTLACEQDCNNVWGGDAVLSACGECAAPGSYTTTCIQDECGDWRQGTTDPLYNSACVDCNGDTWASGPGGGTAYWDPHCADLSGNPVCVGGMTAATACAQDCNGDWGGTATMDNCGVCDSDGANNNLSCADCDGLVPDDLGYVGNYTCAQDCNGLYDDTDSAWDVTSCLDCNDEMWGAAYYDTCGDCVGGSTNLPACVIDCNGVENGTAAIDNCGVCAGGDTGVAACGVDACGVWGGDGMSCLDCNGVVDGPDYYDTCNICVDVDGDQNGGTPTTACTETIQVDNLVWMTGNGTTVGGAANTGLGYWGAVTYCNDLDIYGATYWRLPTEDELTALAGTTGIDVAAPVSSEDYWTLTAGTIGHMTVDDSDPAGSQDEADANINWVRCVRGTVLQ